MRFVVRAPATVANLGPGFDCLALALDLWNEFSLDTEGEPGVEVAGEGAPELADLRRNVVIRTLGRRAAEAGRDLPSFRLACRNRIPLERGLGSSASAVVAGLLLADAVMGIETGPDDLLSAAVEMEGHPDNVGACLRGGVVIVYRTGDLWRVEDLDPHPDLLPVVLVPERERLATDDARSVLPGTVSMEDAVFNISRGGLAVVGLTSRPDLLDVALEDRLHQDARLRLVPEADRVFRELRGLGTPVCVAGSGPSLLAFERDGHPVPDPGPGWRVLRARVAQAGATLEAA